MFILIKWLLLASERWELPPTAHTSVLCSSRNAGGGTWRQNGINSSDLLFDTARGLPQEAFQVIPSGSLYSSEHKPRIWHCLSLFHNYNTNSLHKQITTNKISPILCFLMVQMCFPILLVNSIHCSEVQEHKAQDALVLHVKLL